ncbi:MAG: hypothetical protein J7463_05940 [Roseiflexus sp.]|nr:hypothetical protein [Roseiflexus sp.]MBO9334969.1 hypothetical protein [Roseiflexus sp.]MBO9364813.1 hypothetical protein [Roseiflexus sp.]MBO9381676.1 hypothetical protein [Roseiflexus sp.]MBO9388912.1 hypothetical protein [Roseiflexus sp.]
MNDTLCPRPCPTVAAVRNYFNALRDHLVTGHRCVDAWLALADIVTVPAYRLDCLARASALAPDDIELEIAYLEQRLIVDPGDTEASGALRAARAQRALMRHKPRIFKQMDASPTLGSILVQMGAITQQELEWLLEEQAAIRRRGEQMLFGDVAIARGKVTPETLARALITQIQQRIGNDAAPRALGEYLIASGLPPERLEQALTEQIYLRQVGRRETLGEILIRRRWITRDQLERALAQQQHDALSLFR